VGKKAAAPKATAEDLVRQKLLELATADGPMRLEPKKGAEHPPLFPPRAAGAVKEALARVKDPQQPLVAVLGSGEGEAVRLTAAGFGLIADRLPDDRVGAVAKAVAAELDPAGRVEFLNGVVRRTPAAAAELLPELAAAVAAEKAAAEARAAEAARRRGEEEETRRALARWHELMDRRRRDRVEALKAELLAEGGEVPAPGRPPEAPAPAGPAAPPTSREDLDFRRQVAGGLVSTWLESVRLNKPEGRLFLETALGNVPGIRQVGEDGEPVRFDGRYHESDRGVPTGAEVRVVRPGWVLDEGDGEFRLVPAKVAP
jgi:hypothetical protein